MLEAKQLLLTTFLPIMLTHLNKQALTLIMIYILAVAWKLTALFIKATIKFVTAQAIVQVRQITGN